jgi:NAD(P)-dependent dehydrogenase (short-subunit alcohol dehydrogenase family)
MDWGLDGQTALVTGAAAGIGRAVVQELAGAGARVYGADRAWAGEDDDHDCVRIDLDVTDRGAINDAISRIIDEASSLDVLVNNAGTTVAYESIFDYDEEDWRSLVAVNQTGLFLCLQAAAVHMVAQRRGAIVNVASIAGRNGRTLSVPYGATKAAVINITRSTALALAASDVRVNAVAPGTIDTAFNLRLGAQFGAKQGLTPEQYVESLAERVPLRRLGSPTEVARVICFLASPQASYVTGQTINVDGGILMD